MDVGLDHGGVHAHFAARCQSIALRYFHQSLVHLFDHIGPQGQTPAPHGLGIGRLRAAHPGELAVDQIGTYFALQYRVTPVADVLEDQQAQDNFGRSPEPAAAAALAMPLRQVFVYCRHDLLVRQNLVGVRHPVFPQIAHFLGDQSVAEAQLCPPHLNHVGAPPVFGAAPDAGAHD